VRRLGEATVRRIAITASVLDAADAHRVGIADLAVPNDGIEAALARELANLRRAAPGAVAAVKRLVLESSTEPLTSVLDNGATELLELLRGGDAAEGIAAFLAKRPPRWN
jgi:isohexenylglutaconyl-CoA hydratase